MMCKGAFVYLCGVVGVKLDPTVFTFSWLRLGHRRSGHFAT